MPHSIGAPWSACPHGPPTMPGRTDSLQRPRILALAGSLITVLAIGPAAGAVALAADPVVVVRPGDTLTGISRRHNVSIADLVQLNAIADAGRIFAGQTLRIGTAPAPAPVPAPAAPAVPPADDRKSTRLNS